MWHGERAFADKKWEFGCRSSLKKRSPLIGKLEEKVLLIFLFLCLVGIEVYMADEGIYNGQF